MKKKILSIFALLPVFALASCAGNNGKKDDDKPWWTTTGEVKKDASGNIIFDDVSLSLTHVVCGHDQIGYENLLKRFNTEFDGKIHIDFETIDQLSIDSNVAKRISNNENPPDIVMQHQKSHRNFEFNQQIQPIDECFGYAEIPLAKSNFIPGFADYCDLGYADGSRIFDYPVDGQSVVGYYRKDLLQQLGESIPTDRADMIRIAKKAKSQLGIDKPIAITGNSEFYNFYVTTTALAQNGFTFYDETDKYYSHWNTEQNKDAFLKGIKAIKELDTVEGLYTKANDETSAMNQFAIDNKALFYFDLPFDANTIFDAFSSSHSCTAAEVKSKYIGGFSAAKMFAMDSTKDYAKSIFGDSHAFMVSKTVTDATKKAAIAVFVNWFTSSGEIGAEWAELGHAAGCKPVLESSAYSNNEFVKSFTNNWYGDMSDFKTPGKTPFYSITFGTGVYNAFNKGYAASNDNAAINLLINAETTVNDTISILI